MININEVKEYVEFLARKYQSGGSFTPKQFNLVVPNVVRDIVRKYYGVPEEYQVGNPQPHIAYEITSLVKDYLSAIKPVVTLNVVNGFADKPDDYIHISAARVTSYVNQKVDKYATMVDDTCCGEDGTVQAPKQPKIISVAKKYPIVFLTDTQFDAALNSVSRKPTIEHPIARLEAGKIEIAPTSINQFELSYIRYPKAPFWNGTNNGNGTTTYNPTGSQDIELPNICATEVVLACLQKLGIAIRETQLINWADKTRQMGS